MVSTEVMCIMKRLLGTLELELVMVSHHVVLGTKSNNALNQANSVG